MLETGTLHMRATIYMHTYIYIYTYICNYTHPDFNLPCMCKKVAEGDKKCSTYTNHTQTQFDREYN